MLCVIIEEGAFLNSRNPSYEGEKGIAIKLIKLTNPKF